MSPDSAVTRRAPVAAEDTPAEWAPKKDLGGYIVAQLLGGIAGAGVLAVIANGLLVGYNVGANGLGQNGWGKGYLGGYALSSGVVFEFVATLLFVIVILGSTFQRGQAAESMKSESLRLYLTLAVATQFATRYSRARCGDGPLPQGGMGVTRLDSLSEPTSTSDKKVVEYLLFPA